MDCYRQPHSSWPILRVLDLLCGYGKRPKAKRKEHKENASRRANTRCKREKLLSCADGLGSLEAFQDHGPELGDVAGTQSQHHIPIGSNRTNRFGGRAE